MNHYEIAQRVFLDDPWEDLGTVEARSWYHACLLAQDLPGWRDGFMHYIRMVPDGVYFGDKGTLGGAEGVKSC